MAYAVAPQAVSCPNCRNVFETPPTHHEAICPACMHAFQIVTGDGTGLPALMELEIKGPNAEVLGIMDRHLIREQIYTGVFKGREEIRAKGGSWVAIGTRPEFAEVFQLVGVDLGQLKISQQQIRGWQKTNDLEYAERRTREKEARDAAKVMSLGPVKVSRKPLPVKQLVIGAVTVVVISLVGAVLFVLM